VVVLGFSGLDASQAFLQQEFGQLTGARRTIVQGLDSAAALVAGHEVLAAAAEERFCRDKGTGRFPQRAIEYCLREARMPIGEIDFLAHAFAYEPHRAALTSRSDFARRQFEAVYSHTAQLQTVARHFPEQSWQTKFVPVPHHLAHAASCFYLSGLRESLILIADGMGEVESMTVAIGRDQSIEVVERVPAAHSLGILYGVITMFLGFTFGRDEYKVMGLAPLGNPRRYHSRFEELVELHSDGTLSIPLLAAGANPDQCEPHAGTMLRLAQWFGPARHPADPLTARDRDLAAALQATLQNALLHVLRHQRRRTGQRHLCMAGGVALNCVANGVIQRSRCFDRVYVQPAAGDDGAALGAALFVAHQQPLSSRVCSPPLPLWGPHYDRDAVRTAISHCQGIRHRELDSADQLITETAQRLCDGQVVGWFQGRMEFGPRSLGHRSLLADPRDAAMQQQINDTIKHRESFRPLAPAVTLEDANTYFEIPSGSHALFAAMLATAFVRPRHRGLLPAVTHIDGSARVQIVDRQQLPLFWSLIREFGRRSGVPVLLNTSLNLQGEPIVCSPTDALRAFLASSIDAMVIERFVIEREARR
jgi:carbamoyltransferase